MQFQPPTDGSWLVKIEESDCGRIRLVNPITNIKLRYSKIELSSLDFHLLHLSNSYRLRYTCGFAAFEVNKVALFPYASQLTVIAIYHQGKLGFWRKGDEDWTLLDNSNFDYDDLIPYGDLFYVVDRSGAVSWINSSLEVIRSQIPPRGGGGQKNLVESEGDLYMVDRYLDGRRRNWKDVEDAIDRFPDQIRYLVGTRRSRRWNPSAVDFKVYKMEKELGIWVDVESWVGDRAFVLTNECSFSFKNVGRKSGGNWIYYSDNDDYVARSMMTPESVRVFQYQDRTIHQLCGSSSSSSPVDLDIFRTPPALHLPATS
ncbi:Putative F-box protein At5g60060 [Linum perenne]